MENISFTEESSFIDETELIFNLEFDETGGTVEAAIPQHSTPIKTVYKCNDCNYRTFNRGNLSTHTRAVHRRVKFECTVCKKHYSSHYDLKEHASAVHMQMAILCEYCSKRYSSRKSLSVHKRLVHSGSPMFKCNQCGKCFMTKDHYHGHMNAHMGSKPYACHTCKRTFVYKSSVTRHALICNQMNVERYKCDICGKCMRSSTSLKDHVEGKHGDKKQICICGKAYSWRSALCRHKKKCKVAQSARS